MRVKTNIVLSVLVGGYPVITKGADINKWTREYGEFLCVLPHVSVKGDKSLKLRLNYDACRETILEKCPEFNKVDNFISNHARAQIMASRIVDDKGAYTEDYLKFCGYLIEYAQEETGKEVHEFDESTNER